MDRHTGLTDTVGDGSCIGRTRDCERGKDGKNGTPEVHRCDGYEWGFRIGK